MTSMSVKAIFTRGRSKDGTSDWRDLVKQTHLLWMLHSPDGTCHLICNDTLELVCTYTNFNRR